jgi:hypothetical protein
VRSSTLCLCLVPSSPLHFGDSSVPSRFLDTLWDIPHHMTLGGMISVLESQSKTLTNLSPGREARFWRDSAWRLVSGTFAVWHGEVVVTRKVLKIRLRTLLQQGFSVFLACARAAERSRALSCRSEILQRSRRRRACVSAFSGWASIGLAVRRASHAASLRSFSSARGVLCAWRYLALVRKRCMRMVRARNMRVVISCLAGWDSLCRFDTADRQTAEDRAMPLSLGKLGVGGRGRGFGMRACVWAWRGAVREEQVVRGAVERGLGGEGCWGKHCRMKVAFGAWGYVVGEERGVRQRERGALSRRERAGRSKLRAMMLEWRGIVSIGKAQRLCASRHAKRWGRKTAQDAVCAWRGFVNSAKGAMLLEQGWARHAPRRALARVIECWSDSTARKRGERFRGRAFECAWSRRRTKTAFVGWSARSSRCAFLFLPCPVIRSLSPPLLLLPLLLLIRITLLRVPSLMWRP